MSIRENGSVIFRNLIHYMECGMRFLARLLDDVFLPCALLRSLWTACRRVSLGTAVVFFSSATLTGCGPGTPVESAPDNRASLSDASRMQPVPSALTPAGTTARPSVSTQMIAQTSTLISAPDVASDADVTARNATSPDPVTSVQNSLASDSQQVVPVLSFAPETQQTPKQR